MEFGTLDLPPDLGAVLKTLPPSLVSIAWGQLMEADPDTVSGVLARWHGVASRLPTSEQIQQFAEEKEEGIPFEDLIADNPERLERWNQLLAEAGTPEAKQAALEDAQRWKEGHRAQAVEFCEFLEKLAADQRRYLEFCRQEQERHQAGNQPSSSP